MIDVDEAIKIVQESVLQLPKTKIPLEKALGRVLQQKVTADTDFPPFDRVMMDGIAIRVEDFEKGLRTFAIKGVQAAGAAQMILESGNCCLEVMTGAVTPVDANVVVPYEQVSIDQENNTATVNIDGIIAGKNIHIKGTDKQKGETLMEEGIVMGAPEIAVAASVGETELLVTKNPTIAIISTGDELVDINALPLPHQIRRSNVYAIAAELQRFGIKSNLYHFNDEKDQLEAQLYEVLNDHEVIIMSGGVSRGKFDFVPEILEKLGVQKLFHRIRQKPGKPFWFGITDAKKVVFAFPGNPVSTFLCYHKYFVPWLKKSLGTAETMQGRAILAKDVKIKTGLTYFLQVRLEVNKDGQLLAYPNEGRGSGDHANLLSSNAFLELPANTFDFSRGALFNMISFRNT